MTPGGTPKTSAKNKPALAKRTIRVRMYNVGFGDCFLITLPTDDGNRLLLVDCGFHSQGKGDYSDQDLVKQVKADLKGEPLAVVVATHRHQDHISGFGETALWTGVGVEEVWLPCTMAPGAADDDPSLKAWNGLMTAAHGLIDAQGRLMPDAAQALDARDAEERADAEFMLWNARENGPGIANLLSGFRRPDGRQSERRFLPKEKDIYPTTFTTPVLPGVKVHVLGPPRDPKLRKSKKVPSGWGVGASSARATVDLDSPFDSEWRIEPTRLPSRRPLNNTTLRTIRLFNDDLLAAAKALEGFLNGESLVLVIEIGKARLLLTGDAEVGAWMNILSNPEALALASSATFLKVGHHGSHNATPLTFLKQHLAEHTFAAISTQQGPGKFRNGIPLQQLLQTLGARNMPFVRSDQPPRAAKGVVSPGPAGKWVDLTLPC